MRAIVVTANVDVKTQKGMEQELSIPANEEEEQKLRLHFEDTLHFFGSSDGFDAVMFFQH